MSDEAAAKVWIVERFDGRNTLSVWRTLYRGADEAKAYAVYRRARDSLRQGQVRLSFSGGIKMMCSAPRLRSLW